VNVPAPVRAVPLCCVCGSADESKAGLAAATWFVCRGICWTAYHVRAREIRESYPRQMHPGGISGLDDETREWFRAQRAAAVIPPRAEPGRNTNP